MHMHMMHAYAHPSAVPQAPAPLCTDAPVSAMASSEPLYCIGRFRTAHVLSSGLPGGYKVHCMHRSPPALHPVRPTRALHVFAQGRAEHAGVLGALQLVRPCAVGVVSYIARGPRALGTREVLYSGMERPDMLSYAGEATTSVRPVVDRLMAIARRGGGAIGSPGTLRGIATPLESVLGSDADREWVRARAAEHTLSGTIWVHEGSSWVRNQATRRI